MNRSAVRLRYLPTSRTVQWVFLVALMLLTWGLRLVFLETVPPGWRDDELINIHALSGELFNGSFPLYFTGASGHEPLYHYLHAGFQAVLGYNVLSGHLLSVVMGTLAVALTFALARRLFGFVVAALTALALAVSFWSLIYSRIGLRHISLLPFALAAFYLLWVPLAPRVYAQTPTRTPASAGRRATARWAAPLGLILGLSLYTYPASRSLPMLLVVFALYLLLLHRDLWRQVWGGYALALLITAAVALPLVLALTQGYNEAAAEGIGADARLVELARPIRALREGDPGPLVENVWLTLGMFHATGDPETLYNIPDRPVLNPIGGLLFWAGVLLCLFRWRKPRYFFLLLWLSFGLLPTFLSIPAASLSHSILVKPLAFLLPVLTLNAGFRALQKRLGFARHPYVSLLLVVVILLVFLLPLVYRDLTDYFDRWPRDDFVRFLYRADYRDAARYLDAQADAQDWAVGSLLMGPWDRLALEVDVQREDLGVRLFNPRRAVVYAGSSETASLLLTSYPPPSPSVERLLHHSRQSDSIPSSAPLTVYLLLPYPFLDRGEPLARFVNGLDLLELQWDPDAPLAPGQEPLFFAGWAVSAPLELPPLPVVANPPPPGVYSGPRLAVFAHLLAEDGTLVAGDDGLWVDPLTLQAGDRFVQVHHFTLPPDAPEGPYLLEMGLYDPLTGERWTISSAGTPGAADRMVFPAGQPLAGP